jgi:type IV pilus assembly protein PilA
MAVVAIVSILAVIALPAYLDYVTRSKVSEGLVFVSEAKTTIAEYYHTNREFPLDNETAGLTQASSYGRYDFIRGLSVGPGDGIITVTFKLQGTQGDDKDLQLIPDTSGVEVVWECKAPDTPRGIGSNFVPPSCRG